MLFGHGFPLDFQCLSVSPFNFPLCVLLCLEEGYCSLINRELLEYSAPFKKPEMQTLLCMLPGLCSIVHVCSCQHPKYTLVSLCFGWNMHINHADEHHIVPNWDLLQLGVSFWKDFSTVHVLILHFSFLFFIRAISIQTIQQCNGQFLNQTSWWPCEKIVETVWGRWCNLNGAVGAVWLGHPEWMFAGHHIAGGFFETCTIVKKDSFHYH